MFLWSKPCELCAGSSDSCGLCKRQLQDLEVRRCWSRAWRFSPFSRLCWWCLMEDFLLSPKCGLVPSQTTSEAAAAGVCLRHRVTAALKPSRLISLHLNRSFSKAERGFRVAFHAARCSASTWVILSLPAFSGFEIKWRWVKCCPKNS